MSDRSGHVDAFEPADVPASRLEENLKLNSLDNVTIHRAVASDREGRVTFGFSDEDCIAHVEGAGDFADGGHDVSAIRLDRVLGTTTALAMVKFDIEGYEPFALRGAAELLKDGNPPVMQIEAAGYSKRYGVTTLS